MAGSRLVMVVVVGPNWSRTDADTDAANTEKQRVVKGSQRLDGRRCRASAGGASKMLLGTQSFAPHSLTRRQPDCGESGPTGPVSPERHQLAGGHPAQKELTQLMHIPTAKDRPSSDVLGLMRRATSTTIGFILQRSTSIGSIGSLQDPDVRSDEGSSLCHSVPAGSACHPEEQAVVGRLDAWLH